MRCLSIDEVLAARPATLELNERTLALACEAMDLLWQERAQELGRPYTGTRASSCKFAALLARELFGGQLAGNLDHVFVALVDGSTLDLNVGQPDVLALGPQASRRHDHVLLHREYRESLGSCMPRARRWAEWAHARHESMHARGVAA